MALSVERRNEVAYLVLKETLRRKGIETLRQVPFKRELGNTANAIGLTKVKVEELEELARIIYSELFNELFERRTSSQ